MTTECSHYIVSVASHPQPLRVGERSAQIYQTAMASDGLPPAKSTFSGTLRAANTAQRFRLHSVTASGALVPDHSRSSRALRRRAGELNKWKNYHNENWLHGFGMICLKLIQRPFFYQPLLMVAFYATVVAIIAQSADIVSVMDVGTDVTVGLSTPLALLLAFRLNTSYARWWEGRLLWGRVIENARSIVTGLVTLEGCNEAQLRGVVGWNLAFAATLRLHVGHSSADLSELQTSIETLLTPAGLDTLAHARDGRHAPLLALRSLRQSLASLLRAQRDAGTDPATLIALENFLWARTEDLHQTLSGCERLQRTPSPPGYVAILRWAMVSLLAVLPFVLLEMGFGMVPITIVTAMIMLGSEDVAVQLEVPFGDDNNDLPLDMFCIGLDADLTELLAEASPSVPPPASPPPQNMSPKNQSEVV